MAKKKLPTQPPRMIRPVAEPTVTEPIQEQPLVPEIQEELTKQEEVYIPSENADKYPAPQPAAIQYKILAFRNDYVKLQDEVVKHLNEGWQLTGGISTCMTVSPYESVTVFAQAIFKN